ncbi:hypothetical protein QBC44DRAFT_396304 [Cladorrhinum sp. PSN332]|nr:hypothetical protein QBC44DRAFT_396304 [Cladorrhinum sp. PSN332]
MARSDSLRRLFRFKSRSRDSSQVANKQEASEQPSSVSVEPVPATPAETNEEPTVTEHRIKRGTLGLEVLYEPPEARNPVVDIIVVHGLTGSSYDTWLYCGDGAKTHWPSDLLKADIPDARVLSFGYDADVVGWWSPTSSNRIGNHAENLLGRVMRLKERTCSEDRSVIFVMHSLGGLVVQNALDLSRSSPDAHLRRLEEVTVGLLFMGTPHFGSDKAKWGIFSAAMVNVVKKTNKSIIQVLDPDSEMLATIQKRFHEILRLRQAKNAPISITCFYEELGLPVLGRIVDTKSAQLPGYPSYGVHEVHANMGKFRHAEDQSYQDVVGELLRWSKSAREKAAGPTALEEECLRSLYFNGLQSREEAVKEPLLGTFDWIWDASVCNFPHWLEKGRKKIFWIQGRASSGKSTLIKHIEHTAIFHHHEFSIKRPNIISHYFDGKSQHPFAHSLEGIARTFLWKLLRQDQRFFRFVLPKYLEIKRHRPAMEWTPSVLRDLLVETLSEKQSCPLWFFLDGLDEYPGDLIDIADICNMMVNAASRQVRICVSSRPDQELACTISSSFNIDPVVLELERYTRADIETLANYEVQRLSKDLSAEARTELVSQLSSRADGLFMWARLASRDLVRSCIRGVDYSGLLSGLDLLPKEVNDLYQEVLQKRTTQPYKGEGLLILGLVVFGKRNFSLPEFSFIHSGSTRGLRNPDLASSSRKIDFFTGGLADCRTGRVAVSHGTVNSFIRGIEAEQPSSAQLTEARAKLAQACLLLLRAFEQPKEARADGPTAFGLTDNDGFRLRDLTTYAVDHWLDHLQALEETQGMKPVKNQEITHWCQIRLVRCWEQTTLMGRDDHPVKACLAFVLLLIIPFEVFSPRLETNIVQKTEFGGGNFGLTSLFQIDHAERWRWESPRADLDFLVTISFSPGHSISFHARQMLGSKLGVVTCIAGSPDAGVIRQSPNKAAQRSLHDAKQASRISAIREGIQAQVDWFDLFLKDPSGVQVFKNPVRLRKCLESDFSQVPLPKVNVQVRVDLLSQIKVVLWHYIQLEGGRAAGPTAVTDRDQMEPAELQFATPIHYAAFNGLDLIVEQLHRYGADLNYVSQESRYGSPLMAAIFGLSERKYALAKTRMIETLVRLDTTRKAIDTPANAGSFGEPLTPIHVAVKLHTAYKQRTGLDSEDLAEVIRFLVNEGALVDSTVRSMAKSISGLKRYFLDTPCRNAISSWASELASTPPMPIPPRTLPASRPGNFTIGGLGPLRSTRGGPPGPRIQTFD